MARKLRTVFAVVAIAALSLGAAACSGGSGPEAKYQKAIEKINPKWQVYEVKTEGSQTNIRVEAGDAVSFAEGQKAVEAILQVDPKLNGFLEFYNKDVGIVLRKLAIIPAT